MAAVSQAGALGWACPGARAWRMACGQPWRRGRGRWPNHGKVQPGASIKTLEHRTAPRGPTEKAGVTGGCASRAPGVVFAFEFLLGSHFFTTRTSVDGC